MFHFYRYREESDQIYFEGTGYARVTQEQNRHSRIYEQTIQTTSDEGIVFFAENQVTHKMVEIPFALCILHNNLKTTIH